MKAAYINHYGKLEQIQFGKQPKPIIQDNEILVKVHAVSINPLDLRMVEGEFKAVLPVHFPFILGNDLAGVIVEVGSGVHHFKVGDEVFAKTDGQGCFAEYTSLKETSVALKHKNISMSQAAALPLVALTAWQALVEIAQLRRGQKILIHAGSGGVGSIAIQLAKHLGANVATTTSAKNADWVKELGADIVLDYKTTNFAEVLSDYDVVFDTQGGETLEQSLQVLKTGGTVVSIAGPPDKNMAQAIGANWIMSKIIPLLSLSIRAKAKKRGIHYHFLFMQPNGEQLSRIAELVETQKMVPVLDRVYDFTEFSQAIQHVDGGHTKGKVVVNIS
ncbi:NADP-dependent oxidoreductase [Psychrobacter alimentarius]|uniref:NADP-dependent oxidoreductase n=1 Tax=Psychrobacter alimentarius TaxID=261164 RepID=UPI0019183A3E|nr:NADP-dependent oxidoreductase [Psychrobacter alimentarius]